MRLKTLSILIAMLIAWLSILATECNHGNHEIKDDPIVVSITCRHGTEYTRRLDSSKDVGLVGGGCLVNKDKDAMCAFQVSYSKLNR